MESYKGKHVGELSPHIFAIANECYYSMWQKGDKQCVLIRFVLRKSMHRVTIIENYVEG